MGASVAGAAGRHGGPLVGRGRELRWLAARIAEATAGEPQVLLVEGEPGVGKSSLVAAAAALAAQRGCNVVRGRAYRHVSFPYLPFLDALFPALEGLVATDPGLEPHAVLLRTLEGQPASPSPHPGGALLGVTRLVFELARRQPLVVVVEDVHHADPATLTLLRHLAFRMSEAHDGGRVPLAVVVTARPWSAATDLLGLRRERACTTLVLEGLDLVDTAALLRQLGQPMGAAEVASVWRRTAGNPLFIESVALSGRMQLPVELAAAAAERFASFDDRELAVMAVAALLGPDCRLELLASVAGWDPGSLGALAARAEAAGVVVCEGDRLTFASPLYEAAALDGLPRQEQRRWQGRIAAALAAEPGDHTLAVARHLVDADGAADPDLVRRYAAAAGDRAVATFAWSEASAYYELALRVATADAPAVLARLHHEAGRARVTASDWDAGLRHLDAAARAYERAGDPVGLAAAHLDRVRVAIRQGRFGHSVDTTALEAAVSRMGDRAPALAAAALVDISQTQWMRGDTATARRTAEKALARAEELGDRAVVARAAHSLATACWIELDLAPAWAALERARAAGEAAGDEGSLAATLHRMALLAVCLGRFDAAEEAASAALAYADRVNYPAEQSLALAALVAVAVVRGDFAAAEEHATRARAVEDLTGYAWGAGLVMPALATARVRQGRSADAAAALEAWAASELHHSAVGRSMARVFALWARAWSGEVRGAREAMGPDPERLTAGLALAAGSTACHCAAVELAALTGVPRLAAASLPALQEAKRRGEAVTSGAVFLVSRVAALGAALTGRTEAAIAGLGEAAEAAAAQGAAGEAVLARSHLAWVLARRPGRRDPHRAAILAAEASVAAADLGMTAVVRHLAPLAGGEAVVPPRSGSRRLGPTDDTWRDVATIMFADVVDSTRLSEEWGDHVYRSRARELEHRLRGIVTSAGGLVATGITLGDGILAVFPSPAEALRVALGCAREAPETGLEVRIGLHVGQVTWEAGSAHGSAVNVAARVCERARPGAVLVSETVRAQAEPAVALAFSDHGRHELRGVSKAYRLFEVTGRRGGPTERG